MFSAILNIKKIKTNKTVNKCKKMNKDGEVNRSVHYIVRAKKYASVHIERHNPVASNGSFI